MFIMLPLICFNLKINNFKLLTLSIANLHISISIIAIAEINPNHPISLAIASSFIYNGVVITSPPLNKALIFPMLEFSPTTITTNNPSPFKI